MNGSRQLVGQHPVHLTMATQQTLSLKRLAHHDYLEVAFGARCHPVHVALIDHFQVARGERGGQLGLYLLLHAHGKDSSLNIRPL